MLKKKTAYSILDLAIVSKGKSFGQTFEDVVTLAKQADELDYTRYWLAEHHNSVAIGSSATSILIGKVTENTKRIRVGSGGIMLPNHSPLIVAEQFGTLGWLYPNRIDLGLGRAPGTDQDTARAIRSDFYQAAMAFPEEIEKLENYFSTNSKSNAVRANVAEGVSVPLYILGSSTQSAILAAKKGLPYVFASHFATAHLMNALAIYRRDFKPSAVLKAPFVMAGISVIIAETDEEAEFLSSSYYERVLGILTGDRGQMVAPFEMDGQWRELIKQPAVQQMTKYAFIGSKATVKRKVRAFLEKTLVDEVIAITNIYSAKNRLKSVKWFAEIMTEINEEKI